MEALKKLVHNSWFASLLLVIGIPCIFAYGFLLYYCIAMWFAQGGWLFVFVCFINDCCFALMVILYLKYETDSGKAIS